MVALDHQSALGRSRGQWSPSREALVTFGILLVSGLIGMALLSLAVTVFAGPIPAGVWLAMATVASIMSAFVTGALHSIPSSGADLPSSGRQSGFHS
jgi:hypothetical protein